jgi:hypothetical protein
MPRFTPASTSTCSGLPRSAPCMQVTPIRPHGLIQGYANRTVELQSVRSSPRGDMNRASASRKGRERCSTVRRRGGRRKRNAGRPGSANRLPHLPDSATLVLGQHSPRGPACPRLGVSSTDLDSPVGPSLHLPVSARSCGQGSTSDGGCRRVPFRVEFAIALTWPLRGGNCADCDANRAAKRATILVRSEPDLSQAARLIRWYQ